MLLLLDNNLIIESMKQPRISLEQWTTLAAVVEAGSFAKAAELLNKSQSAVSYALARMEEQLPTPVLRLEGRRAVLTEVGEVLYRRAQQLLDLALDVEQTAQSLAQGWATRLTLAIDAIVPQQPVLAAIARFNQLAPQTRIVLLETTLSGTDEALLERRADLAISPSTPPGFHAHQIGEVQIIAVAHPNHPLARAKHPLTEQELRKTRQIVIRDSGQRRTQNQGWLEAEQRLTVSHFATAIQAIESGLGFAFVPIDFVQKPIERGELVRLHVPDRSERRFPLHLVTATAADPSPALSTLMKTLETSFTLLS